MDVTLLPHWYKTMYMKNYIKEIRKSRGITQERLAEMMNTTQVTVQRHESGARRLKMDIVMQYANVLECHPSDITDGPTSVSVAKSDEEIELLRTFRGLSDSAKQMHLHMLRSFHPDKDKK